MIPIASLLTLAAMAIVPAQPVPAVQGRFNYGGPIAANAVGQAAAFNAGAVRGANAGAAAGFRAGSFNNPYFNSGWYGPGYYDPYGGFTQGVADIVGAQGQFMIDTQQANIMKEQAKQAKIDTRRRNFEEWQYERANTPTLEDEREKSRMEEIRRSRNDPPLTEIWSGKALNDLLTPLIKMNPPSESMAPYIPLDPDVVKRINLNSGTTLGTLGVLKDGGKLTWPFQLQDDKFKADRMKLDQLAPQAFREAQDGQVQFKTLTEMRKTADNLVEILQANVAEMVPNDYIPARRYLTELQSSIRTLQSPDASTFANRKFAAQGGNVYELIANINRQGLRFAPAVDGDQAAYVALHRAMVSYYNAMTGGGGR
jgi:hypothetical protein